MTAVKRPALVLLLAMVAGAVVILAQRLNQERQFQQLMRAGDEALERGESYVAVERFSGALALRPDAMAAYYRRGQAYRDEHQEDRAIRDWREASRLAPQAPEPLVALGSLADARGNSADAADWYRQAADRLRDADTGVLYCLAMALYRSGSPAAAQDPLRRALARDGNLPEAHYLLGLVYRDSQNPDAAVSSLEQAVRLAPGFVAAREELADLYAERGRPVEAHAELAALATLDPGPGRQLALTLASVEAGHFDEALASLRPQDARGDSRVQLATGRVLLARAERLGDRASAARALTTLESALAGTAPRSEGLALFGRALFLTGDLAGAERILREAAATSPVDPEAFQFLADAAEALSHPAVARDALLDLDVLQGDTVTTAVRAARARRLGALSLDLGEARARLTFLVQAYDAGWSDAATLGLLARARWMTGDADGARTALARALSLDARNRELQRLNRTIGFR
jgi:tetratricopeptide (TPR) repeat protein